MQRVVRQSEGGVQTGAKSFPEPGSGTTGSKDNEEEEIEEGRCPHVLCEPCDPTVDQVRMHLLGAHLPFRNWCNACIAAKAKERDHKRPTQEEKENEETRERENKRKSEREHEGTRTRENENTREKDTKRPIE